MITYEAQRMCSRCGKPVAARVVVLSPGSIAYLGSCSHDWAISCPVPGKKGT